MTGCTALDRGKNLLLDAIDRKKKKNVYIGTNIFAIPCAKGAL